MRKGKVEERETYESHKLYVGLELNPLARNSPSDGENCSRAGPYRKVVYQSTETCELV